jgi:hypothetical protein
MVWHPIVKRKNGISFSTIKTKDKTLARVVTVNDFVILAEPALNQLHD